MFARLDGKTWDVFLLVPGAVLGAGAGLIATLAWRRWRGEAADATSSAGPPGAATATARAAADATVNVTIAQTLGAPRRAPRSRRTWLDDLGPGELLVVAFAGAVVTAAAYAFLYDVIQGILVFLGALGGVTALVLLVAVPVAGLRPSARWLLQIGLVLAIFVGVALVPLAMDGADYPHKAWQQVVALSGSRPLEILEHYGAIGVGFTVLQFAGTALAGVAALFAALVLAGVRPPGAAGAESSHLILLLAAVVMLVGGAFVANGRLYRLLEPSAYRADRQNPKLFGLEVRRTAADVVVEGSADEPVRIDVELRPPRSPRVVATRRRWFPAGPVRVTIRTRRAQPRRLDVVVRALDKAGRRSPPRRLRVQAPPAEGRPGRRR